MRPRTYYTRATADGSADSHGVIAVGSYQMSPPTDRPFKVRGTSRTPKTIRTVEIALTEEEAAKLVADFQSFKGQPQFNVRMP